MDLFTIEWARGTAALNYNKLIYYGLATRHNGPQLQ